MSKAKGELSMSKLLFSGVPSLLAGLSLCMPLEAATKSHHGKRTHDDGISFPYEAPQKHMDYIKTVSLNQKPPACHTYWGFSILQIH